MFVFIFARFFSINPDSVSFSDHIESIIDDQPEDDEDDEDEDEEEEEDNDE